MVVDRPPSPGNDSALAMERAASAGSRRPSVDCFEGRLVGVDADFGVLRIHGRCEFAGIGNRKSFIFAMILVGE